MKKNLINEEIFADWLQHPCTEALRAILESRRITRHQEWEEGNVLHLMKEQQALLNAAAIGECKAYRFIQEMDFETMTGELEDGEQKRPASGGSGSTTPDVRAE